MAKVIITGVGSYRKVNQDADIRASLNVIGDTINQFIENQVIEFSEEQGVAVASAISRNATRSLQNLLPFIGQNIIGKRPGSSDATLTAFDFGVRGQASAFGLASRASVNVTWQQLEKKYLQTMQKRTNPTFFKLTGDLQNFFLDQAVATDFARRLGGIRAVYVPAEKVEVAASGSRRATMNQEVREKQKTVGTIQVSLTPSRTISYGRFASSLQEGAVGNGVDIFNPASAKSLDRQLFKDWPINVADKLTNKGPRGRRRPYRPIMQPAIAVWLLQRIPQAIKTTIERFGARNV